MTPDVRKLTEMLSVINQEIYFHFLSKTVSIGIFRHRSPTSESSGQTDKSSFSRKLSVADPKQLSSLIMLRCIILIIL